MHGDYNLLITFLKPSLGPVGRQERMSHHWSCIPNGTCSRHGWFFIIAKSFSAFSPVSNQNQQTRSFMSERFQHSPGTGGFWDSNRAHRPHQAEKAWQRSGLGPTAGVWGGEAGRGAVQGGLSRDSDVPTPSRNKPTAYHVRPEQTFAQPGRKAGQASAVFLRTVRKALNDFSCMCQRAFKPPTQ